MDKINIHNYELFLVDYTEGLLSTEQKKDVEAFLLAHPDISEEFEMFAESTEMVSEVTCSFKDQLKQIPLEKSEPGTEVFSELCIARAEGNMPEDEEQWFDNLIKEDKTKSEEYQRFEKTILEKEHQIFNEKLLIKQGNYPHVINPDNMDEYCVAYLEGYLNADGVKSFEQFLKNSEEAQKTLALFEKTKFTADLSITFNNKQALKKFRILNATTRKIFMYATSAAAMIAIGLVFTWTGNQDHINQMAGSALEAEKQHQTQTITIVEPVEENSVAQQVQTNFSNNTISTKETIANKQTNIKLQETNTLHGEQRVEVQQMNRIENVRFEMSNPSETKQPVILNRSTVEIPPEVQTGALNRLPSVDQVKESVMDPSGKIKTRELAWKAAQACVEGLNKITNQKRQLNRKVEDNKTEIAYSGRFLAFSTSVNR